MSASHIGQMRESADKFVGTHQRACNVAPLTWCTISALCYRVPGKNVVELYVSSAWMAADYPYTLFDKSQNHFVVWNAVHEPGWSTVSCISKHVRDHVHSLSINPPRSLLYCLFYIAPNIRMHKHSIPTSVSYYTTEGHYRTRTSKGAPNLPE